MRLMSLTFRRNQINVLQQQQHKVLTCNPLSRKRFSPTCNPLGPHTHGVPLPQSPSLSQFHFATTINHMPDFYLQLCTQCHTLVHKPFFVCPIVMALK